MALVLWMMLLIWFAEPYPVIQSGPDAQSINVPELTKAEQVFPLYVIRHGWHVGLAFKTQDVFHTLPALQARFSDHPYIEIGWGDRGFYQADEITPSLTLKAIFWPTESVVHAVGLPMHPDDYFLNSQIQTLCVSTEQQAAVLAFVRQSFQYNEQNDLMLLEKGLYGDSQFYSGVGDYYWANTCNKWVATAIKQAGFEGNIFTLLDAGSVQRWVADVVTDYGIDTECGL